MLELATHIVESKAGHFEPERFEDRYEDALKELLKKKQSGEKIEAPRERTRRRSSISWTHYAALWKQNVRAENGASQHRGRAIIAPRRRQDGLALERRRQAELETQRRWAVADRAALAELYFHSFRRARAITATCDPARGTRAPDLRDRLRPRATRRANPLLGQGYLLSHRRHWHGKDNDGKEVFRDTVVRFRAVTSLFKKG